MFPREAEDDHAAKSCAMAGKATGRDSIWLSERAARRVLFKQRDNRFYPPSAWSLAMMLVRVPFQLVEAAIFAGIIYFWTGEKSASVYSRHAESHCCGLWRS